MKNNDDFFGTMFDFDGDGHTDITETYMAYRMMNDDDDSFTPRRAPSGSSSGSGLTAVVVIIVILLIIGWFFGGCSRQSNSKLSSSYSYSSHTAPHIPIKGKPNHLLFSLLQKRVHTNPIPQNQSRVNLQMNTAQRITLTLTISTMTTTMISTIMRMRRIIITSTQIKEVTR